MRAGLGLDPLPPLESPRVQRVVTGEVHVRTQGGLPMDEVK
jgi:hypothetical protein